MHYWFYNLRKNHTHYWNACKKKKCIYIHLHSKSKPLLMIVESSQNGSSNTYYMVYVYAKGKSLSMIIWSSQDGSSNIIKCFVYAKHKSLSMIVESSQDGSNNIIWCMLTPRANSFQLLSEAHKIVAVILSGIFVHQG